MPIIFKPIPRRSREASQQVEPLAPPEDFTLGHNPEASLIVLHPRHGERSCPFQLKMKKTSHFLFGEQTDTTAPTSYQSRTTDDPSCSALTNNNDLNLEKTPIFCWSTHNCDPKDTPVHLFPILPTAAPPLLHPKYQDKGVWLSPARDCPEILLPIIR
jgi:hypothetical protein